MITELTLSHYKSVTDQTVQFGAINVLVGKNGSGKSNIVDALAFLSDVANEDLDYAITKRHGSDSIRQWSKYKPYHVAIGVKIKSQEGEGSYKLVFSSSRNSYRVVEEVFEWKGELTYSDEDVCSTYIRRAQGQITEIDTDYPDDDIDFDELRQMRLDPYDCILSKLHSRFNKVNWIIGFIPRELRSAATFSIFPNTIRSPQIVSRGPVLDADGGNIASILKQLTSERRRRIVKSLKVVLPQIENIAVRSAAGYYVPVLVVGGPAGDDVHELNMSQVSDGTLRILGMLTALFQPQAPDKIILEEPEQMIHPALLIVIRDAILEYARRNLNSQVFLTTHSSVLLDLFDVGSVIAVEYCKGSTSCGPISERQRDVVRSGLMTLGEVLLAEDLELA